MYNKEYHKKYYQENKERWKEYNKKWKENNSEYVKKYRKEYYKKHYQKKGNILKYQGEYQQFNKETNKERCKRYKKQRRLKILNIISNGNIKCARCGCDDIRLLEINHKNGGGCKEAKNAIYQQKLYEDIIKGIRKTDDLEILCRVCNAWHYLELKYNCKLPYKIEYKK